MSDRLMPFGKHKGERLHLIPRAYLLWLLKAVRLQPDLKQDVERTLRGEPLCSTFAEMEQEAQRIVSHDGWRKAVHDLQKGD